MNENLTVTVRDTITSDLGALFEFQLDVEARHLAAFTSADSLNRDAYIKKFTGLIANATVNMKSIFVDGKIVGSVAKFEIEGNAEITYWIDRNYWGKGITTTALSMLLAQEPMLPIEARVAFDNIASQKVLMKCGFQKIGIDHGFAFERKSEIEEFIYKLG